MSQVLDRSAEGGRDHHWPISVVSGAISHLHVPSVHPHPREPHVLADPDYLQESRLRRAMEHL
jgi:hypothetical protein